MDKTINAMKKPDLTREILGEIKQECYDQIPKLQKWLLAYGWSLLAVTSAISVNNKLMSANTGIFVLLLIMIAQALLKSNIGHVSALNRFDLFNCIPEYKLKELEGKKELLEMVEGVSTEDWPDLMKEWIREGVINSIETFSLKVLNKAAYIFLVAAIGNSIFKFN